DVVVLLADHQRVQLAAGGIQRVHGGIDAQRRDVAREHDGRIEMRERGGGRRIGQVVRGHVHRLDGRDRAGLGGGDALLQHAHFFGEGGLITHRGGHAAQQRRHFGAGQGVAVDVVDEEQHVTAAAAFLLLVAEEFGHGQAGERDAQAVARRLVHLAIHHRHLRVLELLGVDDARLDHLVVEVVALAGALTHTGEHRQAAVLLCDVVDQLEHVVGLAHDGAAELNHLAALDEWHQEVDDLDAGDQQVLAARLLVERGRGTVDGQRGLGGHRSAVVLRGAQHVHDAAQGGLAHGHVDRPAGGAHREATLEAFGGTHRDGAHHAVAQLLLHFECQVGIVELQCLVNRRNRIAWELDVDDGADDLDDFAGCHVYFLRNSLRPYTAAAPPTISASSVVIAAWRALL